MCRFVVYSGPPVPFEKLVYEPDHSLESQSYQPGEMLAGTVNVDGFGCGWYNPEISDEPGVYKTMMNLWSDSGFRSISRIIESNLIFGAVRNATHPAPVDLQSIQPLTAGPYLFMHNGHIKEYHTKLKRRLHQQLPEDLYSGLYSQSDSATLFAILYDNLRRQNPSLGNMKTALKNLVDDISRSSNEVGVICYLNIALTDEQSNSLYLLQNGNSFPGACVIASEALDDEPGWEPIAHNTLVSIDKSMSIQTESL